MNRFVNNFTQWVFSRNLTNPGVGSEEIPNFENNDHPNAPPMSPLHCDSVEVQNLLKIEISTTREKHSLTIFNDVT